MAVLVKPQTRAGLSSSCLGFFFFFTSLSRNVSHFLPNLNFILSKVQAEPKNTDKPWGPRPCKMIQGCGLRWQSSVHAVCAQTHLPLRVCPPALPACSSAKRPGQVYPVRRRSRDCSYSRAWAQQTQPTQDLLGLPENIQPLQISTHQ